MKVKLIKINNKQIDLKNLVVIVGANGTGKTRLLDELHSEFTQRKRNSNFWTLEYPNIEIDATDKKIWIDSLKEIYNQNGDVTDYYW